MSGVHANERGQGDEEEEKREHTKNTDGGNCPVIGCRYVSGTLNNSMFIVHSQQSFTRLLAILVRSRK